MRVPYEVDDHEKNHRDNEDFQETFESHGFHAAKF
jgi:hypothetical protein